MKTKKIKRLSIVMSLLLLFNSLGMFAADTVVQDEIVDSSLTENAVNTSYTTEYLQSRMGKYYSDFDEAWCYANTLVVDENNQLEGALDNRLMFRANCYGYAFRMFYALDEYPSGGCYKQQPGEFAYKSATNPLRIYEGEGAFAGDEVDSIANRSELDDFYDEHFWTQQSLASRMSYLIQLIQADATTLGYTVTEYTGTTIPDATANRNSRLIAMVAGPNDYHFYMQHSDNTWSHKLADFLPYYQCLEHQNELTNDNIRTHACEGTNYSGGVLKFFYITKNAIVDFKHRDGTATTTTSTRPITTDLAGSNIYAALDIGYFPEDYQEGCLDYPGDVDYYSVFTSDAETRTVNVNTSSNYTINLTIYKNGTAVATQSATSDVSVTVNFEADSQYYIAITATNFTVYEYGLTYELS